MPRWFTAIPSTDDPPVAVPVDQPSVVQSSARAGVPIPPRRSDCTGLHPSWRPFQVNVCDVDAPDPEPLTARQRSI